MEEKYRQYYEENRGAGDHTEMLIPGAELYRNRLKSGAGLYHDVVQKSDGWVLDVGCGHGGLYHYMNETNYVGVDTLSWMVERARAATGRPILHGDFVSDRFAFDELVIRFDAVMILGVFATCSPEEVANIFIRAFNLSDTVICSWLDASWYGGSMHGYHLGQLTELAARASPVTLKPPVGDDQTWTAVWKRTQQWSMKIVDV